MDKLEFATIRQLQRLHDLKSYDNAYRVMRALENEGLVLSEKREFKIYYLSKDGKTVIGSEKDFPPKRLMEHTLMRNDFYIYLGCPPSWRVESPIKTTTFELIPDATYDDPQGVPVYVEIDNNTVMRENRKKISQYQAINPSFKQRFKRDIYVIFYTSTENRKKLLESYAKNKINIKVYSIFDIN